MNKVLTTIILLFFCSSVHAQNSWMYLPNNGLIKDSLWRIEDVYFTDTNTGFAVSLANRIFKTTNGGVHWKIVNDTSINSAYRSIEFLDDKTIGIAGGISTVGKVILTQDSGNTWFDISGRIQDTTTKGNLRVCGVGHSGNTFYAVGAWNTNTAKFHKSYDKGDTWVTGYIDTNLATALIDVAFVSKDTGFITGAKFSKIPPNYTQTAVILKTTDGGDSWQRIFADSTIGGYVWKIQFIDRQNVVCALQEWYIQDSVNMVKSTDGGNTWSIISVGNKKNLKNPDGGSFVTQSCGFATPAKGWVGGYYEGIFETNDSGKTWNFGYDFNRIFVLDSNHIFAGGNLPYKYGSGIFMNTPNKRNMLTNKSHILHNIAPNPAKGVIKINFDLMNETNVVLAVINLDNRTTYHIANTSLSKGSYTYYWNSTEAMPGNYIIWLGNNEIAQTQKFTLLK
jgi:photosystem II stability/assembly factor-like uncharacterized protein